MMTEIRLDRLPVARIREVNKKLRQSIYAYHPQEITRAPDEIAFKKKGMTYPQMVSDHHSTVKWLCDTAYIIDGEAKMSAAMLNDPSNYARVPGEFDGIETTRRLIFKNAALTGLQIASNYGPYLFYLKDQLGQKRFLGVDPDRFAVAYARRIGNTVLLGDAAALPVASESQDVVVSYNFQAKLYLSLIGRAIESGAIPHSSPDFGLEVRREIWRVLKPGGWFLSDLEIFGQEKERELWMPFGRRQMFSAEAREDMPELFDQLAAFQKPVI